MPLIRSDRDRERESEESVGLGEGLDSGNQPGAETGPSGSDLSAQARMRADEADWALLGARLRADAFLPQAGAVSEENGRISLGSRNGPNGSSAWETVASAMRARTVPAIGAGGPELGIGPLEASVARGSGLFLLADPHTGETRRIRRLVANKKVVDEYIERLQLAWLLEWLLRSFGVEPCRGF